MARSSQVVRNARLLLPGFIVITGATLVLEVFARLASNPLFLPTPSQILRGLVEYYMNGLIFPHIAASLYRCMSGFVCAAALAIPLGIIAGYFSNIRRYVDPLVEVLRPVPPIALIPLLILWFGIGDGSKIVLIFVACFFPIFLSSEHGVARVDRSLINAGRLLGASQRTILWKVIIPGALPEIFTGLRISLAISLLAIVASELVAAENGLGFFILESERTFNTVGVFVGIVTISLLGLIIDFTLRMLRRRVMPWFNEK